MLLKPSTRKLSFCASIAAVTVGILFLASAAPGGKLGLCAAASLLIAAAVLSCGRVWALLAWAAAGILALLILPGKNVAVLYCLMGHYPVCKSLFEQMHSRLAEWICKFLLFYLILFGLYFGLRELFAELFSPPFGLTALVFLLGGVVFAVFDWALSRLIAFYQERIGKHFKFD